MRTCKNCDQDMEQESIAYDAEWICTNPDCNRSPNYVPFLRIPNDVNFRLVNDDTDVSIRLKQTDHTYDDLVILRMAEGDKHYGWFIENVGYDWEDQLPADGPRYFSELEDTVNDAIQYIEQSKDLFWQSKIQLIKNFLTMQM